MKPASIKLMKAAVAIAVLAAIGAVVTAPQPSDDQVISSQLETFRKGITSGNPGQILTVVSATYKDDNFDNNDQLAIAIRRMLPRGSNVQLTFTNEITKIAGDTAETRLHASGRDSTSPVSFDQDVTVYWQREPAHRLLVVPTSTWRVVRAQYSGLPGM